jgi:diacylglycerol kinase (ATP)
VIGNPAAGAGRAGGRAAALVRALAARGHAVEAVTTAGPGDAGRRAAAAEGAVDCIVTAGGDGTLAEVLNGLADPRATPLVPMPLGTANMLARALGVPADPSVLAGWIECAAPRRLDLGLARFAQGPALRFLSVAGAGFDAQVTAAVARTRRGHLGYRGYALPIARTLARYRAPRLAVRLDGEAPIACGLAIVGKLPNYGGVLCVTPDARPDDGRLHACLFLRASGRDLFRFVLPAFRGRLGRRADVVLRPALEIAMEAPEPVAVQLDGDYRGTTPVSLSLAPGVVPVLAGPRDRNAAASG